MSHRLIAIGEPIPNAQLDVVFVHGLTGGPYTTWNGHHDTKQQPANRSLDEVEGFERADEGCMGNLFWPLSLKRALQHSNANPVNVWTLGYPAPLFKLQEPYAYKENLITGAGPCVKKLLHGKVGQTSNREIVFITHSLGGLVTKAILVHCHNSKIREEQRIFDATRGVAFLATPHGGSGLASLLGNLEGILNGIGLTSKVCAWLAGAPVIGTAVALASKFTGWFAEPSNQVGWLERADADLRVLASDYRDLASLGNIRTIAYYETKPIKHLSPKNLLWVVDASNADPGIAGCRPIAVPNCDHIEICKPTPERNFVHDEILRWLKQILEEQSKGTETPVLEDVVREIYMTILRREPERFMSILRKSRKPHSSSL